MGTVKSKVEFSVAPLGSNKEVETDQQGLSDQPQSKRTTTTKQTVKSQLLELPWRSMEWDDEKKKQMLEELDNFRLRNSEVITLRILLYGPVGAGKSSFFNSVNSALEGRITTRALTDAMNAGKSFTINPKIYKLKRGETTLPITLVDTRGMENEGGTGMKTDDIFKILQGHINNMQDIPINAEQKTLKDKIHCLVSVLPANTITLTDDDVISQMRAVRLKARDFGIPQVTIVTKVDEACPHVASDIRNVYRSRKIKTKMEDCSQKLGVPMSYIYPVKNYHEEQRPNTTIDILILTAILNIVNFAKDYVEDQQDTDFDENALKKHYCYTS